VRNNGVTGSIRPDYTGTPGNAAPAGPLPEPGGVRGGRGRAVGDAGRNSITVPNQFQR